LRGLSCSILDSYPWDDKHQTILMIHPCNGRNLDKGLRIDLKIMRRESSWANHEMRGCWSSRSWSRADLATLCKLDSLLHLLLHFLTLVHPFLSLVLHAREREREWGEWKGSEWSWGSAIQKCLHFMLTCGLCPLMVNSSFSTHSAVSAN
jgi:hypothetical protein